MKFLFSAIFISTLLTIIVGLDQYIDIPFDSKPIKINVENKEYIYLSFSIEFDFFLPLYPHCILIQISNIMGSVIS